MLYFSDLKFPPNLIFSIWDEMKDSLDQKLFWKMMAPSDTKMKSQRMDESCLPTRGSDFQKPSQLPRATQIQPRGERARHL